MWQVIAKINGERHSAIAYSDDEVTERREHFRSLAARGSILTIMVIPVRN